MPYSKTTGLPVPNYFEDCECCSNFWHMLWRHPHVLAIFVVSYGYILSFAGYVAYYWWHNVPF